MIQERTTALRSSSILALFPGQGTQAVGMGRRAAEASAAAAQVFDLASDILRIDARELCWRTPDAELKRTKNAQPAITIAALASWAVASEELMGSSAVVAAGHSVGAISAAAAAGYLSMPTAVRLAASRGELMGSVAGHGSMLAVAINGLPTADEQEERAHELAARFHVDVGAVNGPRQVVLSGPRDLIERACAQLEGRAKMLAVSHAFHSRMMAPVESQWCAMVDAVEMEPAPTWSYQGSILAMRARTAEDVRQDLRASLTMPVLWSRVMESTMTLSEVRVFGPGGVLARLVRPYRGGRTVTQVDVS